MSPRGISAGNARCRLRRALSIATALLLPGLAIAAATAPAGRPFAAPEAASTPPPAGVVGLGQVTLALGIVLAAMFTLAWLVRQLRGTGSRGGAALDVIAEVRLGPKERAVLVKVGSTQLLLGVAPGHVNALHVLAEPVQPTPVAPGAPDRPSFRQLLMKSLGRS